MEYTEKILAGLRDEERFVRLVFSHPSRKAHSEWDKVVVQPVRLAAGRTLQAIFHGEHKENRLTITPAEVEPRLAELMSMHFRRMHLQCTDADLHIRISKKGKALVKVGRPSVSDLPELAAHDREKNYPLAVGKADDFLEAAGIMHNGKVRAAMQGKFRQINHFVDLLRHTALLSGAGLEKLHVIDCGCGRALLSLAACHYLRDVAGLRVSMVGVDVDDKVIAAAAQLRAAVGERDMKLVHSRILDYAPETRPDIVLSLHACDTATDEALAQGVKWGASLILAAPCCQHELHRRLDRQEFRAVLRHGILRERTADIVTDALRAAALRAVGYKAEVIEFISPEHTSKNLMIRAEKVSGMRQPEMMREYLALRNFWNLRPAIETLLGEMLPL